MNDTETCLAVTSFVDKTFTFVEGESGQLNTVFTTVVTILPRLILPVLLRLFIAKHYYRKEILLRSLIQMSLAVLLHSIDIDTTVFESRNNCKLYAVL